MLSPRERVFRALEHRPPDRVPLDDAWMAHIRMDTWDALKQYLGAKDDEDLRRKLGFDFRYLTIDMSEDFKKKTKFYYPFGYFKPVSEDVFEDEWGVRYQITSTGLHWRYVYHPLSEVEDPDEYEFPDIDAPGRFDEAIRVAKLYKDEYVLQAFLHQTLFEWSWALRGFNKFIMDLYTNEKFVNKLLDKMLKYRMEIGERYIEIGADIIQLGDDFGIQTGMVISPELWRKYFKPRMRTLINDLKKHSGNEIYIFYHSDGYIEPIIPELIEIGVDILNPVQPECMDPAKIKEKYGDKLTLHGTISIQETLPKGSVKDVESEVMRRISECGPGGGLILCPSNQVLVDTPIENFLAIYSTARRYGWYPRTKL